MQVILVWVLYSTGWVEPEECRRIEIDNRVQKVVYSIFGTNFHIGHQIKAQIQMLETRIPPEFKQRNLDDLGCGDGKITLLLKELFQPRVLRGFDVNPALVKRARNNGIEAEAKDLDLEFPRGELAVMWGVMHHLKDKELCLKRISDNYQMAFIREPIKNNAIDGLEMGKPLIREEIENLITKYLSGAAFFYYGHCIFIFYTTSPHRLIKPSTK